MGLFSAIVGVGSTLLGMKGAKDSAEAQKQQAKANAAIARKNAAFARENQRDVLLMGRTAEIDKWGEINRAISSTRAAQAGAGLVVDEAGTVTADQIDDMIYMGATDIRRIRNNVELEQRKFERQEESFNLQAKFGTQAANSINPNFAAISAGIRGFSNNFDLIF